MTFLTICSQANVTVTYLFSWPHNTPGHSHYTCHTVQNVRPGPSPLCAPVYMVSPAEKVSRDARHTRRQSTKGHFSQTLPCTPSVQTYRHSGWLVFVVAVFHFFLFVLLPKDSCLLKRRCCILFISIKIPLICMKSSNYLVSDLKNRKKSQQNNHHSWQTLSAELYV